MSHYEHPVDSDHLYINVNTINIRGGLSVISSFLKTQKNQKTKKKQKNKKKTKKNEKNKKQIKNKKTQKTKKNINNNNQSTTNQTENLNPQKNTVEKCKKLSALYLWIQSQQDSITVLTETKQNPERSSIFNKLFEEDFYILSNYYLEEKPTTKDTVKRSKHGTITLIPKKSYLVQHKIVKQGMISKSMVTPKKFPNFSFTLVSYYNPSTKEYPDLFYSHMKKFLKHENLIIAGDFNQITSLEGDYNRLTGNIKPNTKKSKSEKADKFRNFLKQTELSFNKSEDFTFEKRVDNEVVYQSRIDWIFYSAKMNKYSHHYKVKQAPFDTDHKIVSQSFLINDLEIERKPKQNFAIPNDIYHFHTTTRRCNQQG